MQLQEVRGTRNEMGRDADDHDKRIGGYDLATNQFPPEPRGDGADIPAHVGDHRNHTPRQRQSPRNLLLTRHRNDRHVRS